MRQLFDRFVVVDWSANSVPKTGRDSIWSCVLDPRSTTIELINHPTRHAARAYLIDLLLATRARVLIGFDLPYGYPRGFARAARLDRAQPWLATWNHLTRAITDQPDNTTNRFLVAAALNAVVSEGAGPFWGTTADRHVTPHLSRTKAPGFPHAGLAEFRATEMAMRATRRWPASVWQLSGAGSVGSQALTGLPVIRHLRVHPGLTHRSIIWPFETGLSTDPTAGRADMIVHAEIWPSGIAVDRSRHPVKDAAQVICLCEHLARLDAGGDLPSLFAPDLDPAIVTDVLEEEGWILGGPQPQRPGRLPV